MLKRNEKSLPQTPVYLRRNSCRMVVLGVPMMRLLFPGVNKSWRANQHAERDSDCSHEARLKMTGGLSLTLFPFSLRN